MIDYCINIVGANGVCPQAVIEIVGVKVVYHESVIGECHRLRANAIRPYSNVLTSIK